MSNNKKIKDFSNKPVPDVTDAFLLEAADGTYYYVTQLQLAGSITAGYLAYLSDTAAGWTSNNPILPDGSIGIESDTMLTSPKFKIAFSSNHWNDLPYANVSLSGLTTNKVLKAGSATTAVDSNITDDGTTVTVNSPTVITSDNSNNQIISIDNLKALVAHDVKILFNSPIYSFANMQANEIVATDASKNLVSLSTATYPSLTELSYGKGVTSAIQTQLDGKANNLIYKINTPITHTGTTAETILNPSTFLSGFEANDFLMIDLRFATNNNANTKTVKVYVNTSHSLVGATQIATMAGGANVSGYVWLTRELQFNNSLSSTNVFGPTTNYTTDQSASSNTAPTTLTFDFTSGCYFIITGILNASAADTITIRGLKLKINR